MPRIDGLLSWNMGCGAATGVDIHTQTRRLKLLGRLVARRTPSLIALQEAPPEADLRKTLGPDFDLVATPGAVVAAYRSDRWSPDYTDVSDPRVAVVGLRPVGASVSLWMLSVHGPALYISAQQKGSFIRTQVAAPLKARRAVDDLRLNIVAGDMNMPPFDYSIVSKEGLHANRSLRWAAAHTAGVDRAMFNSTWILLGRCADAPGSLYRSGIDHDGPWYGCDQILLSAEFALHSKFKIDVIDKIHRTRLRKSGPIGAPDETIGSDHLPLFAALGVT